MKRASVRDMGAYGDRLQEDRMEKVAASVKTRKPRGLGKQKKIEALIELRDYIREKIAPEALPQSMCDNFNILAAAIRVDAPENWCIFGIVPKKEVKL